MKQKPEATWWQECFWLVATVLPVLFIFWNFSVVFVSAADLLPGSLTIVIDLAKFIVSGIMRTPNTGSESALSDFFMQRPDYARDLRDFEDAGVRMIVEIFFVKFAAKKTRFFNE